MGADQDSPVAFPLRRIRLHYRGSIQCSPLLLVGCILEPIAAILVVMPILLPIGMQLGFDPVHFGVFVVCALSVGFITPPVGINLFAAAAVSDVPFTRIAYKALPAFLALIGAVFVIAASPSLVLWFR